MTIVYRQVSRNQMTPLIFDPPGRSISKYSDPRSFCFEIEWLPEIEWLLHHASIQKQTSQWKFRHCQHGRPTRSRVHVSVRRPSIPSGRRCDGFAAVVRAGGRRRDDTGITPDPTNEQKSWYYMDYFDNNYHNTDTHPFNGPFSGTTQVSRYQKGKLIWILLKQGTVSGSGVSRAICKSAPRSKQITTPASHHSVFYRPDDLPAVQPTSSKHWRHNSNYHKLNAK